MTCPQRQSFAYDGLDRLTSFARGTLTPAKDAISGTTGRSQAWSLDALGNWDQLDQSTNGVAEPTQYRYHDAQNRLLGVDDDADLATPLPTFPPSPEVGEDPAYLVYSSNGEMLRDEAGRELTYDAWGRLVQVDPDPNTSGDEISYAHDALYRKIESTDTGSTRHWYHSVGWQVIEERDGPASTDAVVQQHVWSPVYVDAMVLRDRDTDGDGDPRDAGGGERLYVTHDANFNVTGVIGEDGSGGWEVNERYVYDPYGSRAVLDADWSSDADELSDVTFHHGRNDAAGAVTCPVTQGKDGQFWFDHLAGIEFTALHLRRAEEITDPSDIDWPVMQPPPLPSALGRAPIDL